MAAETTRRQFRVTEDFGARGNDEADDTQRIWDAYTELVAEGGGDLIFSRDKSYLCNTQMGEADGLAWILAIADDRVRFVGEGGKGSTRLRTTSTDARLLFIAGGGKPEGPGLWQKYAPWRYAGDTKADSTPITPVCPNPLLPIAPAAKAAMSVTCVDPADADGLHAGDDIVIRSGQLVDNASHWNAEPDCEYNRVVLADPDTGIVLLERPLKKPYVQEYQDAIGDRSSTVSAAVPAPLGIVKLTGAVIEDVGVLGLTLDGLAPNTQIPFNIRGVVSRGQFDYRVETSNHACDALEYRDCEFDIDALMTGDVLSAYWPFTSAVGCSDNRVRVRASAPSSMAYLHLHEGGADIDVEDAVLYSGVGGGSPSIGVRARAYGVNVHRYRIAGAGDDVGVLVDELCDGGVYLGRGAINSPNGGRSILIQAPNVYALPPIDGKGGDIQYDNRVICAPAEKQYLAGWVSHDTQSVFLGRVPAQHTVTDVYLDVVEGFDSGGTDQVSVGRADDQESYAVLTDVHTAGLATPGAGSQLKRHVGMPYDVYAYYVNGGSEPLNGKARVIVEFTLDPTEVA